MSQICNLWLGQFCQNFHASFNPGQSSYEHLPLYRTFLCLNSVNIFVVTHPTPPLVQCCRYHTQQTVFVHQHCMGGGVACERRRISVRRLGEGVGERNESAPVRSFHPYPPPQIPILAPRGAHTYACTAGWGEQTAGTFACSRPAFRLWKMKKKMYIACKEEKILREAKGKSTIWGQWPVIAIVRSRVQARIPRESTPRDAKEINVQKNS